MSDNNSTDIILGIQFDEQDASKNLKKVMSKIQNNSGELGFTIGVDDKALEGKISTLAKSAKAMLEKQTANLDINVNDTSLKTLKGKLDEIKKASYQLTDLKIDTKIDSNGLDVINKSILVYKDNLGKTIKETMVLKQEIDKLTNKPISVFKTDKVNYVSNYDAIDKAYANDKKAVYQELINLQRQEFSLKEKMIGKEGELRDVLNEQLKLNRQKQGEVWKFSNDKGLKDAELGNNYLVHRQGLLDKLKVSQTQYNQNLENEKKKIAENIKLYQEQMNTRLKGFTDKNKDIIPQTDLANLQKRLNELNATSLSGLQTEIKKVNNEFEQLKMATKANGKSLGGMDYLIESGKKFATWFGIAGVTTSFVQTFQEGLQYAKEMDKQFNQIAIVTSKNKDEVRELREEYQGMAKDLKVLEQDYAKATVEFWRQGLSDADVSKNAETTMKYSKISDLDAKESAEILTATVNSMNVDIKKASDVFAYLGDATATGADEIGQAFQRAGGTVASMGVEFEKASSWIAEISSRTRESSETIGNSIKSIVARYASLREKGYTEEGVKTNQVSKALNEVGIKMIDTQGQFRNLGNVMDELGAKWKELDSRQQVKIALSYASYVEKSA